MVIINSNYSPFSFFIIIFLSDDIYKKGDIKKIITHEKIHVQQKHSFDLIILELLTIIQWFNPFIWFYKSTIKEIHEFLADEGVLSEGHSRTDYQELLLNQTFGIQLNGISNNFNPACVGLIKRRFIMMSKLKTNKSVLLKMVFIVPLAVILTLVISISISEKVIAYEIPDDSKIETLKIADFPQEDKVYEVVEQMPKYPGGDKSRVAFIVENTKYPEKARKEGITGTVMVSFIVEKDGKITNVELLKGIGGGCDEEAMRVVSIMPQWEPGMNKGKPVRVQFNMPFSFMLDRNKTKKKEPLREPPPPPSPPDK